MVCSNKNNVPQTVPRKYKRTKGIFLLQAASVLRIAAAVRLNSEFPIWSVRPLLFLLKRYIMRKAGCDFKSDCKDAAGFSRFPCACAHTLMCYREGPDKHLCRTDFIIRKMVWEFVTKVRQNCEETMYMVWGANGMCMPFIFKKFLFHFFVHSHTVICHCDNAVVLLLADTNGDLGLVISRSILRFLP